MKKSFYVSLALLALGSGVQAQQFTEVSRMEVAPSIMGGRYFSGGKPLFMTTDEGASGNGFTATLYDTDLSEVKRIDLNLPVQTYYTTVKARPEVRLKDDDQTRENELYMPDYVGETILDREGLISWLEGYSGVPDRDIFTTEDGIMWYVSYYDEYYFDEAAGTYVGDKSYPIDGYYLTPDNKVFAFHYAYEWRCVGDWKEEQRVYERTDPTFPMACYVYYIMDDNVVDQFNNELTQTLFNDDDKFEYLYETWESAPADTIEYDRDNDGEIDSIVVNNKFVYTGIELRQEDGTVLFRHDYSEDPEYGTSDCFMIDLGEKVYLVLGTGNFESVFYSIDKSTSSVSKVKSLPGMLRAYPNPARSGEVLTMDLPEAGAADARRDVRVTSMDGRTMMRQQVGRGERQVQIPLRRMPAGVYNFTLTENGRVVENSRIVVK